MALRMTLAIAVLALVGAVAAPAGAADVTGRVIRIEPEHHVVVLSDGRTYRLSSNTVVYVGDRAVTLGALSPGQTVVIRSGQAAEIQNGQTITVSPGQPATPAAPGPAAASGPAVAPGPAAAPGSTVVVTPPATTSPGVRQTLYGRVDDVDDDGTVKIDTGRDSFKVTLSRDLVRQIREGDTVQLDLTVVPAGTPAASPR